MQKAKSQGERCINSCFGYLIALYQCDKSQPHCRNCEKYGVVCSFAIPQTVLSTPQADLSETPVSLPGPESTVSGTFRAPAQISQALPSLCSLGPFPSTLAVFDLEMLHHWTTSTCYTLSGSPAVQTVWCNEAPRIGFTTPPVLRTLVASSALHLARSDEPRRVACLAHAQTHHCTAVRGYLCSLVCICAPDRVNVVDGRTKLAPHDTSILCIGSQIPRLAIMATRDYWWEP
ncbi:unnamed protein product [Penicillium nalgiovense]|uniref:Zn(2)-C6 fungal-type domain-containing protein n=1 Tax=Penicillium nalgiovense TaxID=60175 RepID=A0A9W4H9J7_PENNA|nr:unnamed protein product [Penicillium nalgiovense]CAG7943451.1 unnamed protein product [Penicillium nalgiovense]CAG8021649.1 unnamed protein product [Penicillium nalgiovense]CAG8027292.1 unnamed protein product [Penicillium nalgiovense]CAG8050823.1 unnamed protein product [Penicillium nalgiovense]